MPGLPSVSGCPRRRGHPAPSPRAARHLAALGLLAATVALAIVPAGVASAASTQTTASAYVLPAAAAPAPSPSPGGPGIGLGPGAPTDPVTAPPPATAPTSTSGSGDDPSWWDIPGQIKKAIDDFFAGLVKDALNPVLSLIGRTVLATPDVTTMGRVGQIWTGMAVLANSLYVLFILAGAVVIMTHETLQTRYAAKQIIPRLFVGFLAGNASLALLGLVIHLADVLSEGIMGQGLDPAQAGPALANMITGQITGLGGGIFLSVLGLAVAAMAVVLLVTYIVRVALMVILAVSAPLALACHALPQTDPLARLWWRAVVGTLAVQLGQSLTLIVALQVMLDPGGQTGLGIPTTGGLVDLLVFLALFWILIKIPSWVGRGVFGRAHNSAMGIAKEIVVYKALGALGSALKRRPKVATGQQTPRPVGTALALRTSGGGGGAGGGARPGGWSAGPTVYTVTRVPRPSAPTAARALPGAGPRLAIGPGPDGPTPTSGPPGLGPGPRGRRLTAPTGEPAARGPFPMPPAVQDRLAARQRAAAEAPKPRYVQNGLFPPVPKTARPAPASTLTDIPAPPAARSGVRQQAIFARTGEPTAAALPPPGTGSSLAPTPVPARAPRAAPVPPAAPQPAPPAATATAARMRAASPSATPVPTAAPTPPRRPAAPPTPTPTPAPAPGAPRAPRSKG